MKEQITKSFDKLKDFWNRQPKKKRLLFGVSAGGIFLAAVVATVLLNMPKMGYKVLYPGISDAEAMQVYATLQEMDVQPEINKKGELMVPADQWDGLLFQLAGRGYPKSTLSYDTFLNNTGFTTTEYEKKQAMLFQLQDRLQQTLMMQEGIDRAVVTFNIPETSNYIWDQNNQEQSSAGITVTMKPGFELSPERVNAIKNLTASSVPKMRPENVVVVDGATGIEMSAVDSSEAGFYNTKRLEFERQVEKAIEDNIKRLLSGKYGPDGVQAVAKVSLDYDKMITEKKEFVPKDDGSGVVSHYEEQYSLNGEIPASGIVGEENNTDVPQYPNQDGTGDVPVTDYSKMVDYDISYVLTQIEKGEPLLKKASVAVIVNDAEFDQQREELLVDLISKSVNIPSENIRVTNLDFAATPAAAAPQQPAPNLRLLLIIGIGGLLFVLIAAIIISAMLRRSKRQRLEREEQLIQQAEEQKKRDLEREIAEHKRMLQEEAQANSNTKENAITEEIREFAQSNPEITATLIRSMLKEEK